MNMMINDPAIRAEVRLRAALAACDEVDSACDELDTARDKARVRWIETRVELALALREGRQLHKDNRDFNDWLQTKGLNALGDHDRAALIHIADHTDLFRRQPEPLSQGALARSHAADHSCPAGQEYHRTRIALRPH
ncbi:MAG: hypothetical protein JO110_20865 [Acetobacteraceae bacterium]|nr:hypothetical protein [Acetobacteraceae bacterium]